MEFPRDFGNQGQWIPATPAKHIPVKRPAPMPMPPVMSGPSCLSSIDVNGPSDLSWSVPNHGMSPALGSASRGQQIDGRGGGEINSINVNGVSGLPRSIPNHEQFEALGAASRRQRRQIDDRGDWELNDIGVNGVSGLQWSVQNCGQSAALGLASWGQQTAGRGGGELGTLGTLIFNSDGISQMPYTRLLATSDPTIMSKMNLPPFMIARIGGGVGSSRSQGMDAELSSQNQMMLNGKTLLPPNREDGNTRSLPQLVPKPQHRMPFPFLPNLNSLPENNMASRVVSEAMASPATPATMEKNQREWIQGHLPHEIIDLDLIDETTSYQDLLRNESNKLPQPVADKPVEQCFSNHVESSQVVNYQHQEGERNVALNSSEEVTVQQAEGESQGIDLNKTPPPKPRKRKYTPKVIREGKPARTPKTTTPKPPKAAENPSGKRKYVRKSKDASPQDTPSKPQETSSKPVETVSSALGEIVDQDSRSRNISVRRSLNFDLEDSHAVDQLSRSGPTMVRQNSLETQGPEAHAGAETVVSSRTSLAVHCSQEQGTVVMENSMGSGIRFDLSSSTNQVVNEKVRILQTPNQPPRPSRLDLLKANWQADFVSMLKNMNQSQQSVRREGENVRIRQTPNQPPQPSRLDLLKSKWQTDLKSMVKNVNQSQQSVRREGENLKKLARMMDCQNIPGNHWRHLQDGQNPAASNIISTAQREKRNYNLVDNAQVAVNTSIVQPDNGTSKVSGNDNVSSTNPCFPHVRKRRRVESGQQELPPNASSLSDCNPPSGWKTIHTTQNTSKVHTLADAQRFLALGKSQSSKRMLAYDQVDRETNDRLAQDQRPTSTPVKPSGQNKMDCNQPPTPEKAPGYSNGQENGIYGPQARVEVIIANQAKPKVRRRKKERDPLVNSMVTNVNQVENVTFASQSGSSLMTESAQQKSSKRAAHLETSFTQDCHISGSYKASAHSGFRSGALVSYMDPMEIIVRKLRHLNINGVHEHGTVQPQNALVPYAGESGTMVPFEGPFDHLKRRKPRPRVDLDPESNRVWKLLMGKDGGEGEEGTHMDKEKWWEEERRVFRGRADSFIARMHLIQGDRRFSRWKGSVLDSVIGVFLTQNVSDHLSSSAFMCLAARFPPQSTGNDKTAIVEKISRPIVVNDTSRCQGEVSEPEICGQSSPGINASERMHNKEMDNSNESLESNAGGGYVGYSKESILDFQEIERGIGHESPDSGSGTAATVTSCTSVVEGDDRKSLEDVVSSQNSVASSQNSSACPGQATDRSKPSPLLSFEADELLAGGRGNGFSSFRELLEMADGKVLNDLNATGNERILSAEHGGMIDWSAALQIDKSPSVPNGYACLNGSGQSIYTSNSHIHQAQHDFSNLSRAPSLSYCYQNFLSSRFVVMEKADVIINESNQSYLPPSAFELNQRSINEIMGRQYGSCTGSSTYAMNQKEPLIANVAPRADSFGPIKKNPVQPIASGIVVRPLQTEKHSSCQSEASSMKNVSSICLNQRDGNGVLFQNRESEAEFHMERSRKAVETQAEIQNCGTVQPCSNSHNADQRNNLVPGGAIESNLRNEVYTTQKISAEMLNNASKGKKVKVESEKKKTYDWDSLRKQVYHNNAKKERSSDAMDSLDYEAVRNADVNEISNTIRERGMNNMLAERIKDFLNRLVKDHGSTDLEWLRDVPPDKAKDYLLSIRGLGLKSVECVRLLTLHHLAFPVDTNVGRICVRLGWVPLQPLPESLQLHLLEMYPILETIQKYLWPRLCKLDQRTLYELHYQLITFGKVFCTKSKPNCNACPMRGECKHFASAYASARLALPGPEEKHLVSSMTRLSSDRSHGPVSNPMPLPQLERSTHLQEQGVSRNCEPIIEEPATPEPECIETTEIDIEDAFYNDPDEIPTIKLNFEEFTQNLHNYMQENNMGLQDGDMSKALVAITPEAASIPTPKLKNVNRLRTEHQVYELPDSHPLLEGLDKREPDDPCPYLLAIWTPGETAQSAEPPTSCCDAQDSGKLCNKSTCFSCNSLREAQAQMVRGTILIPCRTANRGSFPLNGTYFQVNEVFADHDSSRNPIDVPRDWIWNLPRRTVYFGTSTPSIFKGLTTEGIQHCFWRGFVCVRGFDRTSRAPRPLFARLHFSASKVTRNKKTGAAAREDG